ncbi:hypothetical protein ABB37_07873 [Leptomonas pyrrhocoris]|uniref:Uncharacterized protein n=1 Tax=Leptomonas pyrrhocoris TaxID=157538 RepID=A0A0M9FUA3_LEPPY|nr:hypothetical protein ABB37_07873 [Leptomonas pyrrhocoris]KPA76097.1 hypothetical protein ABB37_07873 [Leptomonas pyrrhocoris]|eukprot:XP_015654536.1 hypothetical protein ABB37_07873 [Leptomonas pyrrhocoris]
MGCVVCTSSATTGAPRNRRPSHVTYVYAGGNARVPTPAAGNGDSSPLSSSPPRQLRGVKVVVDSGSEGPACAVADTTQPHQVASVGRRNRRRDNVSFSSGDIAPPLSGRDTNGAASPDAAAATAASVASRQSKLSLQGSPFPVSPTKQQRMSSTRGGGGGGGISALAAALGFTVSDGARWGIPTSTRSQPSQHNPPHLSHHHLSSTASTSGQGHNMRDSMLSDISELISPVSTTVTSAPDLISPGHGNAFGARTSIKTSWLRHGEDLETQRQQAPLSIDADFFVYDDIVISKDEARTKHWRLAGRKPTITLENSAADNTPGGRSRRSSSLKAKRYFTFNDFDVCVDEMDWMPATAGAAGVIAPLQQSSDAAAIQPDLRSMTVTNTVASVPNTVAHAEELARKVAPPFNRPLHSLQTTTMLGHATRVKCIALSPAETEYVSCSNEDASISLMNLGVRAEVGIFTGHQDTIINATFSPDGKYLATTSKDKSMILWDVMTARMLLTLTHPKVVICCCFSPDSKYFVSGCQDRTCRLWDTKRGKEWLSYTAHDGIIIAIAFSPDGNYVCSASADKSLRVWSATTAKTRLHLTGHTGIILSCSYTGDGRYIISNDESLLRVWSAEDGSCTLSLSPAHVASSALRSARGPKLGWTLSSAAPGAFTGYMVAACNNRFIYVMDIESGAEVTSAFCKAPVYCLAVGSCERMACGDSFGNIYIFTLK